MKLWESVLLLVAVESIYSILLVLIASLILLINSIVKKSVTTSLFSSFLTSVTLPLLLVKPSCKLIDTRFDLNVDDFKPLLYFIIALAANDIVKYATTFLKTFLELLLKKENVNKILQFVIQLLTKLQIKEEEKD